MSLNGACRPKASLCGTRSSQVSSYNYNYNYNYSYNDNYNYLPVRHEDLAPPLELLQLRPREQRAERVRQRHARAQCDHELYVAVLARIQQGCDRACGTHGSSAKAPSSPGVLTASRQCGLEFD